MADLTNQNKLAGNLTDAIKNADIFIGVSKKDLLTQDMIKTMANKPIIFALANPEPEIMPDKALEAGAFVVATGRSDFFNQVNNVLAFPGIFKGALESSAKQITQNMKLAAAKTLAELVLNPTQENILPNTLDKKTAPAIAEAVKNAR